MSVLWTTTDPSAMLTGPDTELQQLRTNLRWVVSITTDPALCLAGLAHAQDLPALQLVVLLNIRQGLGPQLGGVEPLPQVPALGLGQLALGTLTPCAVLFALPMEMNLLLHY